MLNSLIESLSNYLRNMRQAYDVRDKSLFQAHREEFDKLYFGNPSIRKDHGVKDIKLNYDNLINLAAFKFKK